MKQTNPLSRLERIGLLADSHGNQLSIAKGIARLNEFGVEALIHLGDVFDSVENDNLYEIWETIIQHKFLAVKGNNDFQVENRLSNGYDFDLSLVKKHKILSFIQNMPMRFVDNDICYTHSLPFDSIRSFYEPVDNGDTDRAAQLFAETSYKIMFCGHSHSSILFRYAAGHVTRELIHSDETIFFSNSERYIVIVGSSDNGECGIFDKGRRTYQRLGIET